MQSIPITQALSEWPQYLTELGRREETLKKYPRLVTLAAEWAGWTLITDIHRRDVRRYAHWMAEQGKRSQTIKNAVGAIRSFTRFLVDEEYLEKDPIPVSPPIPTTECGTGAVAITLEHCRKMIAAGQYRLETSRAPREAAEAPFIYAFLFVTALRKNEARHVTWRDAHLDGDVPYIRVPASLAKSKREGLAALSDEMAGILRARRGADDDRIIPLWPDHNTRSLDADLAGIPYHVSWHSFRKGTATFLAESSIAASAQCRHSGTEVTRAHYIDSRRVVYPKVKDLVLLPGYKQATHRIVPPSITPEDLCESHRLAFAVLREIQKSDEWIPDRRWFKAVRCSYETLSRAKKRLLAAGLIESSHVGRGVKSRPISDWNPALEAPSQSHPSGGSTRSPGPGDDSSSP